MMDVWDPGEEKTVLSQIKKLISRRYRGLGTSRYLLYPGILLILLFVIFGLLVGCSPLNIAQGTGKVVSMIWSKEKEDTITITDLRTNEEIDDTANTIACIKLQPECDPDREN